MRNQEAARYARWAAMAAGLIALVVAGVYVQRVIRQARARLHAPPVVPATVEQQSAQFSFSKVEQDRTLFTIRASQATRYKDKNRALLEDVWITVYGREGNRNDNIHTHECSYEPESGAVRCQGEVRIDLENANSVPGKPAKQSLEVKTSDLSFDRDTGEALTPAPVEFRFPGGQGRGVGVIYSMHDSVVRVGHSVEFDLSPSDRTGGRPVSATGSSLEIRRDDRVAVLGGPVTVRQGDRELSADKVSIELDDNYRARRAVAEGHPAIRAAEGGGKFNVSADRFEAFLSPTGSLERIVADGNVTGARQAPAGTDHFSAGRAEFAMLPEHNLVEDMTASGGVTAESQQGGDSRLLKTDSLRLTFSSGFAAGTAKGPVPGMNQRIETAETLAPATIESRSGNETTTLRARNFVAHFGSNGRLEKLFGHSGAEARRQIGDAAPQVISSAELAATFGPNGDWDTLDETGNVRFQQADRQASAARATIARATNIVTLDGSPVLSDSMSRTTAGSATINQKSGEIQAAGGVVATYLPLAQGDAVNLGFGVAHISADTLSGSNTSGHVVFAGHARLWQGESVLDADQIELWRDDKRMQAAGHVVAVFPQASGPLSQLPGKSPGSPSGPTLWQVRAPTLVYWSELGKAHLEGGVVASSQQGSLDSRTLDVFLAPVGITPAVGASSAATARPSGTPHIPAGRQLSRVLAQGNVVVRQDDRLGMADQAEYTAADGKFVLSGGQPTLTDASRDTTTGHSLTFFVASDTILIDSQEGSRTLTKHRVEK